jgi:integrase
MDGKRTSQFFTSYDEAVAWRAKQVDAALRGRRSAVAGRRTTFAEHWESWRASVVRRVNTLAQYDSTYRMYLEPAWGRVPVGRITRQAAQAWVKDLIDYKDEHDRGLSASRIIRCVAIASVCLQVLVDDEILDRNPFRRPDVPALPDEEAKFVTVDESVAIDAAMDPWWRLTIPLLLDTGLRIGELAGLRVCDVAMRGRTSTINVRQIVTETGGHLKVGSPKTRAGVREVPTVTQELAERLADHIAERGLLGADHLFMGERGGIMRPNNWRSRAFADALESSALEESELITPYSFRHGAVALWIHAGVTDEYKLARWLGHEKPSTVRKMYGHLIAEETKYLTDQLSAERSAARQRIARSAGEVVVPLPVPGATG